MKRIGIVLLIITMLMTGCKSNEVIIYEDSGFVVGTFATIKILSTSKVPKTDFGDIFDRLREIEAKMTINQDVNSEVQLINASAGIKEVKVSNETYEVVKQGIYYSELTKGRFDITVGPLVKLWHIGFDTSQVPDDQAIEKAIALIDYKKVALLEENKIKLNEEGMIIDLGGIAKGYAADEVVRMLVDKGYESAIINIGGNIYCLGEKKDGKPYKIGIRDPLGAQDDYLGTISLKNKTVVSSGIYEKNFVQDNRLYHHIFDAVTGYPVENELLSVSIITDQSMKADALSTGVFVLGLEKGIEFVEEFEGVEAVFVTRSKEIYLTSGVKKIFDSVSDEYTIK